MGRLYLPSEALAEAGIASQDPFEVLSDPALDSACRILADRARSHFDAAEAVMACCKRDSVRSPRLMAAVYRAMLDRLVVARLATAAAQAPSLHADGHLGGVPPRPALMAHGTVHIVGAGLAGLSAAVSLSGFRRKVVVHELAHHAGGRCRSYFEPALGLTIDNGNHLVLSGNPCRSRVP